MKRGSWLVLAWLVILALLSISCTQNIPAGQSEVQVETTTTVVPPTTETEAETELATTTATPTHEPIPASFSVRDLTITPGEVTPGVSVNSVIIEVLVMNDGELPGTYDVILKIDNTIEATEKVTLQGGSSQKVTFTKTGVTAKTYSVNINGLTGTFEIMPPPLPDMDEFMKGIHFNDWPFKLDRPRPPMYGPIYYPPQADVSLKDLATTGANWISVMVNIYQETISSTNITQNPYATPTDEALQHVIDLAHSLGIRVALLPDLLLSQDPTHDHVEIGNAFTTEEQWQEWFGSYREHINHYASFAQEAGVDLFYIGCEMAGATHREAEWRQIVKEVRERFKGPISYDSVFWGFPISEYQRIKWWDAVDYIATDFWGSLTDKDDPTVAELKAGFIKTGYVTDLENISTQFNKPIIISEIGVYCVDGVNKCLGCNPEGIPEDLQEQADCYQAFLEVLWGKPWLKGIFWFQWNAISVEWTVSPQNKPAEDILKSFYLSDE